MAFAAQCRAAQHADPSDSPTLLDAPSPTATASARATSESRWLRQEPGSATVPFLPRLPDERE